VVRVAVALPVVVGVLVPIHILVVMVMMNGSQVSGRAVLLRHVVQILVMMGCGRRIRNRHCCTVIRLHAPEKSQLPTKPIISRLREHRSERARSPSLVMNRGRRGALTGAGGVALGEGA